MRISLVLIVLSLAGCGEVVRDEPLVSRAQQGLSMEEREQRIGDPLVDYKDPEYRITADGGLVTFLDRDNTIWLGGVDSDGRLVPADGRGTALGTNGPYFRSANGPEFGVSARGEAVVWTGVDTTGVRQFFMHRNGVTTQLTHGPDDVSANLPCKDPQASEQKLLGFTLVGGVQSWFWITESDPETRHPVPLAKFGSAGPWWYLDTSRILTNTNDANGVAQVTLVEPNGATRVLTSGGLPKVDMLAFRAPELGGAPVLLTILEERRQRRKLAFFEVDETTPVLVPLRVVPFATELRSPEPFVFQNTSGASVVVTGQGTNDIVLAQLDGGVTTVSDSSPLARTDPETFVIGSSLFVSYYATSRTEPTALFHTRLGP
ncbi:MAG: hypothetical protein JNM69_41385 [Archangium sp.]|nr:hypothetical protein [Archangium sp.]